MYKQFSVNLSEEDRKHLRVIAAVLDVSMASLVRAIVRDYLADYRQGIGNDTKIDRIPEEYFSAD